MDFSKANQIAVWALLRQIKSLYRAYKSKSNRCMGFIRANQFAEIRADRWKTRGPSRQPKSQSTEHTVEANFIFS